MRSGKFCCRWENISANPPQNNTFPISIVCTQPSSNIDSSFSTIELLASLFSWRLSKQTDGIYKANQIQIFGNGYTNTLYTLIDISFVIPYTPCSRRSGGGRGKKLSRFFLRKSDKAEIKIQICNQILQLDWNQVAKNRNHVPNDLLLFEKFLISFCDCLHPAFTAEEEKYSSIDFPLRPPPKRLERNLFRLSVKFSMIIRRHSRAI